VYKIEQHGKISLRRPKLSKEEVKRLMKKKKLVRSELGQYATIWLNRQTNKKYNQASIPICDLKFILKCEL